MRGVPAHLAPLLIMARRAIQIFAGLGLVFGQHRRMCAVALILFVVPAALIAHSFWRALSQLSNTGAQFPQEPIDDRRLILDRFHESRDQSGTRPYSVEKLPQKSIPGFRISVIHVIAVNNQAIRLKQPPLGRLLPSGCTVDRRSGPSIHI
jgi:hypothetical protein